MTRIKMCGMTRVEDALYAAALGADAVGFIFYEKSARFISAKQAQKIIAALPPFVTTVGVFVNAGDQITTILQEVPLDVLQFHGEESPKECGRFGRPFIKTVLMQENMDLRKVCTDYADAQALLLDSSSHNAYGGTGITFDWNWVPHDLPKPIILAGGLTPENVAAAIAVVQPFAVDVASGIEAAKGIKDHGKMERFFKAVQ